MTGDVCRAINGKTPRKPEKRKKRKQKRKSTPQKPTHAGMDPIDISPSGLPLPRTMSPTFSEPPTHQEPRAEWPVSGSGGPGSGSLSPRRQTLMRHKTSSESFPEPSFVSEVKEIKRNRRRGSAGSSKPRDADTVDGKYSLMLSNQPMEEKASLFMASTARIVSYQENVHESPLRTSPGTLLAHGEFEIFQLHGGDVTYLACGKSFVYPLLPKLNILRTSAREFVLPLVNPQRYWKIHIDSTEDSVFVGLESVLKKVVKYTNMAIPAEAVSAPIKEAEFGSGPLEVASSDSPSHAGHVIEAPASPKNTPGSSKPSNYVPYFNDIPESPPSVPVSPQQVNLYKTPPTFPVNEESLSSWDSTKDTAENTYSITSAVASFGITNAPEPHENNPRATSLIHPRPHPLANRTNSLSNPFYQGKPGNSHISAGNKIIDRQRPAPEDTKSESSSMDSLLDEYEETISVTKSVQHNISRPVSRTPSHISAARSTALSAALQYTRLVVAPGHDYETNSRPLHRRNGAESSQIDGFPTASLSRYERARQDSADGRSRRSSVSELYSSTSNWMEPSQIAPVKKLASSKSTYSLAGNSLEKGGKANLNEAYREIYRSLTSHNISQMVENNPGQSQVQPHAQPHAYPNVQTQAPGMDNGEVYPGKHQAFNTAWHAPKLQRNSNVRSAARAPRNDGLSSVEVFKLLSERDSCQQPAPSGFRKLFGW